MARDQLDREIEEVALVEACGSSATLASKASPAIAACMWPALKRAMAYWVSEIRGGGRLAFRAASVRAR
jgi:hypothetical protein